MKKVILILVFGSFAMGLHAQCDSLKDATIYVGGNPVLSNYKSNLLPERLQSDLLEMIQNTSIASVLAKRAGMVNPCDSVNKNDSLDFERIRGYLCEGMVEFRNLLISYGQVGSFDTFLNELNVNRGEITPISKKLLQEIYEYSKWNEQYIRDNYSGIGMARAFTGGNTATLDVVINNIMDAINTDSMVILMPGLFGVDDYQNNPLGAQSEVILLNVLNEINNAGLVVQLIEFCNEFLDESDLKEITGSDFVLKILNVANIKTIIFEDNKTNCKVFFIDGTFCNLTVSESDRLVSINFETNNYQIYFHEDRLIINDLTSGTETEYSNSVSDIAGNIDKTITASIAIMFYWQEIGNFNYKKKEEPYYEIETYMCLYFKKSYCSEERKKKTLTKYCGKEPAHIGGTDCGCLWGDFLCVCIVDFEC